MKLSFSATNPCHVFELARAVHGEGSLGAFFSGYPRWKLNNPGNMPVVEASWRTLLTYGLQRVPERFRPPDDKVFRWQDEGFDRAVARKITRASTDVLHGLPGQALETFRAARKLGIRCILNHASGPLRQQRKLVRPEYERAGMVLENRLPLPAEWERRLEEEMELADGHCAASSVVRDQLVAEGVPVERILVVPYGADESIFEKRLKPPAGPFRICFAGQQSLRKGIHYLLRSLSDQSGADWELHLYGPASSETTADFAAYRGPARLVRHGAVSQVELSEAFRQMHVLVLPSVEEAFGLVVVQALQCGLPCIVSDRVGAKDLIREGRTGSVFPFGDSESLSRLLQEWEQRRGQVEDTFPWEDAARKLIQLSNANPSTNP